MSILSKIYKFINKPHVALFIIIIFLISYIIFADESGGFKDNFLVFGPTKNKDGDYTTFAGLELNTWKKIIVIYVMLFFTNILQTYYTNVIDINVNPYIWNKNVKNVPFSKYLIYFLMAINPFIELLLYIINFFATATFQIQFIIPQFIGKYISNLPFIIKMLNNKRFI